MQEAFESLQARREEAKNRQIVKRTEVSLCYRDAASIWGDSGMIWNIWMIYSEHRLAERFIRMSKDLNAYV